MKNPSTKKAVNNSTEIELSKKEINIPVSIFTDRSLASLEVVVEYLKDKENLSYHEIAILLNRDDRTIWTCYHRAKIKRKKIDKNG